MDTRWFPSEGLDEVPSPALLVDPARIEKNIQSLCAMMEGRLDDLCPHVKTHKMAEVVKLHLKHGIRHFKCATPTEARMTAKAGAGSVLLAHQPVGPNRVRLLELVREFPDVNFSTVVDDLDVARDLSKTFEGEGGLPVWVDVDCGMHRTGAPPGEAAFDLACRVVELPGLHLAGLHVYDGHIHHPDPEERSLACDQAWKPVEDLVLRLEELGLTLPAVMAGGTPTFPCHAKRRKVGSIPVACSPGTTALWDAGYATHFPDLPFRVAALLLTRVISRPGENRLCLDLGHKAVAAENPLDRRLILPGLPDVEFVSQSEEHLVIRTPKASQCPPGTALIAVPWHVCPTVALHEEAWLLEDGRISGQRWQVTARHRF